MAHPEQLEFVGLIKKQFPEFFSHKRVLEVGSLDINGSVKSHFEECEYTGVDVGDGPGVDLVSGGQAVELPTDHFDVAISCECFEHNPYWRETLANMLRMTKPGGLVVISCAGPGREEHGTTRTTPTHSPLTVDIGWDYYANVSTDELLAAAAWDWWCDETMTGTNWFSMDSYLVGFRKPFRDDRFAALKSELEAFCRPQNARAKLVKLSVTCGGETGAHVLRQAARVLGIGRRG